MSLVIPSIFQVTDSEIQTIDANDIKERIDESTYALFRQAVDDIKVIRLQFLTLCATSFCKDSTVVLLAAFCPIYHQRFIKLKKSALYFIHIQLLSLNCFY